jgi:hypothetical protein
VWIVRGAAHLIFVLALIFNKQGTADTASDQTSGDRCMAQMYWNQGIANELGNMTHGTAFQTLKALVFTGDRLFEYGMIPLRLVHSSDLVNFLGMALSMCAAMRMLRDGLSAHEAFAAVVNSNGLSAEYFG